MGKVEATRSEGVNSVTFPVWEVLSGMRKETGGRSHRAYLGTFWNAATGKSKGPGLGATDARLPPASYETDQPGLAGSVRKAGGSCCLGTCPRQA